MYGLLFLLIGIAVGALAAWGYFQARIQNDDQMALRFQSLSAQMMQSNNESFLQLAKTSLEKYQEGAKFDLEKKHSAIHEMVKPLREALEKVDGKIQSLEKARVGAYEGIKEQIKHLHQSHQQLQSETQNLVTALRSPTVRGRWGEIQLKRVVEMAGMVDHCDFSEQITTQSEDKKLRPDLVIHLPGDKSIVVDAKAPLMGFLEAVEAKDDSIRLEKLKTHARHIRSHIQLLSQKNYWSQFAHAPEFVVLFLPGETFFSAALEQDPSLIEMGVDQNVILSTPTTLIALLRAVAYGWRQEKLAENAKQISDLGKELYRRMASISSSFGQVGGSLMKAVDSYNKAVGTLETRVLPCARRFKELEAANQGVSFEELQPIEKSTRKMEAPELKDVQVPPQKPLGPVKTPTV